MLNNNRLMVVEDNPDLLDIYQICLRKHGYHVVCATDGEDGLHKFINFKPRVVLCDIKMPKLPGFDMIEMINTFPKLRQRTTIIVMSAYGGRTMMERARQLGISSKRYLIKSQVTLNDMLKTVKAAF